MTHSIYFIAGEASGDGLGAGLMQALRAAQPDVEFHGIGGEKMQAQGLQSLFPYHELSLMGFAEIVPHLAHLWSRLHQAAEDIIVKKPAVVVTVDSPGFNFLLVRWLRREPALKSTRFVHYVAPSVWAYKPQRAKKCAALFHHLLCLLPFEPPYFEREGLPATFVGHPAAFLAHDGDASFRSRYAIGPDQPLICLMPGSRKNEVRRHMAVFAQTIAILAEAYPDIAMAVPVPLRLLPMVADAFKGCPFRTVLIGEEEEKRHAIAASSVALVKSGTVSLEVAAQGCPQVVTYRASPITAFILRRMIRIKFANLVNLVLNREAIPELIQERCTPHYLANALEPLLKYPHLRVAQAAASAEAFAQMRSPDGRAPAQIAAEIVLKSIA